MCVNTLIEHQPIGWENFTTRRTGPCAGDSGVGVSARRKDLLVPVLVLVLVLVMLGVVVVVVVVGVEMEMGVGWRRVVG